MSDKLSTPLLKDRFRGYFPVVIDVETAGFNAQTDALLEICAITLKMDSDGFLVPNTCIHFHTLPGENTNIEQTALDFLKIKDPFANTRNAIDEKDALKEIFKQVRKEQKAANCQRSLIVAHNAKFDHGFVMEAASRCNIKRNPFHPFATFDTATLSGLAYGQTVLAKACETSGIGFDNNEAHGAKYDTTQTAKLFCEIVNNWQKLGGWPLNK